jgi:hypothetical protein
VKLHFLTNWRFWIALPLTIGLAAVAFVAGGAAEMRSYWPFGDRYPSLERMLKRVTEGVEREFDNYSKTAMLTGVHELIVQGYPLPFRDTAAFLALSDTEFLVATRLGDLNYVVIGGEAVSARLIGSLGVPGDMPFKAGVKDLLLIAPGKLLASVTTHNAAKDCYGLALFEYSFDIDEKSLKQTRKLFESGPCLSLPLALEESGGRIVRFSDDSVLLSVGNLGLGVEGLVGDYGRAFKIRVSDGFSSVFVTGLRNAQGLFVDPELGLVFETEHGPRGGDEINVLREGTNYGYPNVTYGTNYSVIDDASVDDTCLSKCGTHMGYELPLFAFVPSIGISNLVRYPSSGAEFHRWRGNLLVESLRAGTLFRLEYVDGRIIFSEPIPFETRLRDIALLPSGSIVLLTYKAKLLVLTRAKAIAQQ